LGFGHRHWNRFEVMRWVGNKGRRLRFLWESTWLACRFLRDMIVRDIGIFKIRLTPTGRGVVRRAEGKLGGRERRYNRRGWSGERRRNDRSRRVSWSRLLNYRRVVNGLTGKTEDRARGAEDRTGRAYNSGTWWM
jgi:hypothetical protein